MDTGFNLFEPQPILHSPPSPSPASAPAPAPAPRRRWRRALLASAAVLAVAGAGTGFLVSPYNHLFPIGTGLLVSTGNPGTPVREPGAEGTAPAVMAPAARLAGTPRQETRPAVRGTVASADPDAQTREILGLRGGSDKQPAAATTGVADTAVGQSERATNTPSSKLPGPAAVPAGLPTAEVGASPVQPPASPAPLAAVPPPPAAGSAAMEPGMAAPAPALATPAAPAPRLSMAAVDPASAAIETDPADTQPQAQGVTDALKPATPAPPAVSAPVAATAAQTGAPYAASASADAVVTAIALRPNPMARGEQIDVLHLVAQLGTVIRDLRTENAGLRASTKASSDKVDTAVADFERRLALAESHGAIKAAMADMDAPPEPATPTATPSRTTRLSRGATPQPASLEKPTATAAIPAGARRYKVQAASPGLAMLSELDRSGGEGSQVQVKVGDQVPGYGRVVAIAQQGVAWTVKTEHGAIQ